MMNKYISTSSQWEIFLHLIRRNKSFQIGLLLKLVLALFFASPYLAELFIPFIKTAVSGGFLNIYKDYYAINQIAFPYPPLMFYILFVPVWIESLLTGLNQTISFSDLFFIKLPLLFGDIIILVILIKWLNNIKSVLKWYWFNPIVIYVSYIHGQLDIIPTALLCLSLYFLFVNRLWLFLLFLAFACATKFHVIITIPLLLVFLVKTKKVDIRYLLMWSLVFITLLFLLNSPYIFQNAFVKMVYQNAEQGKALRSSLSIFDGYYIILIPAFYMVILYLIMDFSFINKDILLIFLALSFGIITLFIVPGQGWYMWNMPFLVYFIIRFQFKASVLFVLFNLAYFLFFIIYSKSDFPLVAQYINPQLRFADNVYAFLLKHRLNADILVQLSFTFLQTSLLLLCASIFRIGVLKIRGQKIYFKPYLVGICGDSGTGKSTLSDILQDLFGDRNTLIIKGDDMHRWERGNEKWTVFTHLNPKANWLHRDLSHLIDLKVGKKIFRKHYDHETGKFTDEKVVDPNKIIVYEGLHTFYLKEASRIYDLKIFMKPSEELRRYWKVTRDVYHRGYTKEKVIEAIETRMLDSVNHILDQEVEADIIFSVENIHEIDFHDLSDTVQDTQLKIICSNDIYFEQLLDQLRIKTDLIITHEINHIKQAISIYGKVHADLLQEIASNLGLDIEDLTGSNPIWNPEYFGLMQIFILYQIMTQFKRNGMLLKTDIL
ncbi:MAG: hypothetical protein Q8R50_12220 [Sediminibacterium sp.]|nr:hypothetical protein [Sediminibacterium sp.]